MKVRVIEGFEMTGKTSYIRKTSNHKDVVLIDFKDKFGYGVGKYGIDHEKSWVIGASWFHLLARSTGVVHQDAKFIIDRGLLSSVVYTVVNSKGEQKKHMNYLMNEMIIDYRAVQAEIEYLHHTDESIAKKMFDSARFGRPGTDHFDSYENFHEYWVAYSKYHTHFSIILDMIECMGVKVSRVSTSDVWRDSYE